MKKFIFIITLFAVSYSGVAQFNPEIAEQKTKQEIKEEKRKEREKAASLIKKVIEDQQFVLEADMIFNRYGQSMPVAPNINFIMIDSTQATIQLGSAHNIGWNGVGGVTIQGNITSYDVSMNKRKDNVSVTFYVLSSLGNFDIRLNISANGNATAQVRDNRGGMLRYSGDFQTLGGSNVYVGNRTF
ncbi:MAG: DUF4251 domain-containing protein [Cyclobacteriaceae bacterium]